MSIMQRSQLRAACAFLSWSQERLAEASGVSLATIKRLESGEGMLATKVETVEKLRRAFEAAGIEFTDGDACTWRQTQERPNRRSGRINPCREADERE